MGRCDYYNEDCIDGMKDIETGSVDLIIADPPYFEVMVKDYKGTSYEWDKQWDSLQSYLEWCKSWLEQIYRVMKSNGSFYLFSDDKNSAHIQVEIDKTLNLENNIVWVKPNNMTVKGWQRYRCFSPITERILFYSKESRNRNLENDFYRDNIEVFRPIIEYMIEQKQKIKASFKFETDKAFNDYVNEITNTKSVVSRHYFTFSQWTFPTKEIYEKLQSINENIFEKDYKVFQKEYNDLKKEYQSRIRTFNPRKNYTDVWSFNITSSKEDTIHPTQKPLQLIKRIITASSNENDLVLDPFLGSGTTGVACKQLNRKFIGFEKNVDYYEKAKKRLEGVKKSPSLKKWF